MPGRVGEDGRKAYLDAYRKRLEEVDDTPRLFFHPAEDYGKNERLNPGAAARSRARRTARRRMTKPKQAGRNRRIDRPLRSSRSCRLSCLYAGVLPYPQSVISADRVGRSWPIITRSVLSSFGRSTGICSPVTI